jgi:hypothetical protein
MLYFYKLSDIYGGDESAFPVDAETCGPVLHDTLHVVRDAERDGIV